jgi:hypothetical protein
MEKNLRFNIDRFSDGEPLPTVTVTKGYFLPKTKPKKS